MKTDLKAILIFLSISISSCLSAQTDQFDHRTEAADSSVSKFMQKYSYFTRAQIEEKSLFKLNLISELGLVGGAHVRTSIIWAPSLLFEHKILPNWSAIIEMSYSIIDVNYGSLNAINAVEYRYKHSTFSIGTRYYYNMNRRIRLGKQANNFSGNYLFGQYNDQIVYEREEKLFHNVPTNFTLGYGIQRRLWKYGFLDLGLGAGYSKQEGAFPYINFAIGFGL